SSSSAGSTPCPAPSSAASSSGWSASTPRACRRARRRSRPTWSWCSSSSCGPTACSASRGSSGCDVPGTATGIHHRSYESELRLRHTRAEYVRLALIVVALALPPLVLNNYWLCIVNTIGIATIGAVGLNILVGLTGQISLGQGGFLAVGAFTSALLAGRAGLPMPLS